MTSWMVKQVLNPLVLLLKLKKHKTIWKYKEHLKATPKPSELEIYTFQSYFRRFGSWIGHQADFKGTPCFPHGPHGIFISNGATLGKNCTIFQHVTIGSNTLNDTKRSGSPVIGDNVYIGAGAKIIGGVTIGNNCRIGANAVVYNDLPDNALAVQQPTRIIQKDNLDNRYHMNDGKNWYYFDDDKWIIDEDKQYP